VYGAREFTEEDGRTAKRSPSRANAQGAGYFPGIPAMVSNKGMQAENHTDSRLTELEIKASFAEDLLEQLDKIIVRQQQQIDALLREVAELKAAPVRDGDITAARSLRDELPPHF